MKMISEFNNDERISEQLLVVSCSKNMSTNNIPYLNIEFKDRSGTIYGKKWDYSEGDEDLFAPGNILLVNAETSIYRNNLQLKVTSATPLDSEEIDFSKFTKDTPSNFEALQKELDKYIASVSDPKLREVMTTAIKKYENGYYNSPAGKNIHHDYKHGLLTHILSMCEIGEFLSHHYEDVDYDILMTAIILHDIGKTVELEGELIYTYTTEGKLLGHISIGEAIVQETCKEVGLDHEKSVLLEHCILAHHGQLEFGSPVMPLTKEALILSLIDQVDSKVEALNKALESTKEGEFSSKIFALDNRSFYKPKK